MFHQIEGLVVDKGITMADLKGTLDDPGQGSSTAPDSVIRLRPHHFPFTEPSCEVDVQCFECHGAGCRTCKGEGWIELLGAGMVHPKVLRGLRHRPGDVLRLCLRHRPGAYGHAPLPASRDMRLIFENDIRFLSQF